MADQKHEHGTMDTRVQEKTFEGFMKISARVAIGSILLLIFIALVNG